MNWSWSVRFPRPGTSRPAAALAAALVLGACEGNGLDRLAVGEQGRVAEVISGDTLVLEDGQVVRLASIDAPNLDEPYAQQAAAALITLAAGKEVTLLYGGRRRDGYGRALAQVRLKDGRLWLQERLVADGAARVRTYADNRALAADLLKVEARARARGAGLWALKAYEVRLPVEAKGQPGFQIVEGRVTGAYGERDGAELDLDQGVTVKIPRRIAPEFSRAQRDPGRLKGRLVRVRGYLDRDDAMRLDHPEQLEPLREAR